MIQYEKKITRYSNLAENDSLSVYDSEWAAQQNHNAFEAFYYFLNEIKPNRILEIGTALGGFTSFLNYACKKLEIDCNILSYDIYERLEYDTMRQQGIDVRIEDVFLNNYSEVKTEIQDFIKSEGITLILCDGGDKIKEFNILSNFLKPGDFIMAHDYAESHQVFEEKINLKIWNWHEISDADIEEACTRNNLTTYNKNMFDKVVWVCKKKN
jgi:predicted O-methyltransferase YrrM